MILCFETTEKNTFLTAFLNVWKKAVENVSLMGQCVGVFLVIEGQWADLLIFC